jgi:2-phospho-L-lactate guanylyltransferase
MTAAVVPVKTLAASKTRLFPDLEHAAVERLTLAMMTDVIAALQRVPALTRIAVVTPDTAVARAAEAAGAEALLRPDPGLNAAVERAAAEVCGARGDGLLVVLGDVAAVAPADLETLLGVAGNSGAPGVALAPSRDGGTSALLRTPRDVIPARFGPDSAKRHREEAARAGVPCRQIALPSLAIDIDVADDAAEILRTATLGPHTREALDALGMGAP